MAKLGALHLVFDKREIRLGESPIRKVLVTEKFSLYITTLMLMDCQH
jgi:hypothetical protein